MNIPALENLPYEEYSTRQLLAIPLILFTLAAVTLGAWTVLTGAPVDLGTVFVGGTEIRVDVGDSVDSPQEQIETMYAAQPETVTPVPSSDSYIVTFQSGTITADEIESTTGNVAGLTLTEISTVSPTLGADAQQRALGGIAVAFVLMSLLVIALFRSFIPAVAIIASAIIDLTVPIAAMNIIGVEFAFGTVGALLMLIGYSVDSDILLNNQVLRERGDFSESVAEAMRTGLTMTATSFSAMVVMFIVAQLFGVGLLADMGLVLSIGLFTDVLNTYLMNVSLLRWYTEGGQA